MSVELNQATPLFSAPRSSKCGLITKGLKVALGLIKDLFYTNLSTLYSTSHDLGERVFVPRRESAVTPMAPSMNTTYAIEDFDDESEIEHSDDAVSDVCGVNNDLVDPHASEQGLIYAIYNRETETFSYLIGTLHRAVNTALYNRYIPSIIEKCEAVYTENGAAYLQLIETDVLSAPISYDSVIENIALQKDKEVVALDRSLGIVDEMLVYIKEAEEQGREVSPFEQQLLLVCDPEDPDSTPEKFAPELVRLLKCGHLVTPMDSWQKGNTAILAAKRNDIANFSPKYYQKALLRREKAWLEELNDKLETSKTSICIAVGASHLVGKDGLVAQLQKKGFDVYQTTFSDCAIDDFLFDD